MDKFFTDHIRQSKKGQAGNPIQQRDGDDGVTADEPAKKFPRGVVLGKDGKPYGPTSPPVSALRL